MAPNVLLAKGARKWLRPNYLLWRETTPSLIVEVTSEETQKEDEDKKSLYERLGVEELILFDPYEEYLQPQLQGYQLVAGRYQPIPLEADGSLLSQTTGLRFLSEGNRLRLVDMDVVTEQPILWQKEFRAAWKAEEAAHWAAEGRAGRAEAEAAKEAAARQAAEERVRAPEGEIGSASEGENCVSSEERSPLLPCHLRGIADTDLDHHLPRPLRSSGRTSLSMTARSPSNVSGDGGEVEAEESLKCNLGHGSRSYAGRTRSLLIDAERQSTRSSRAI